MTNIQNTCLSKQHTKSNPNGITDRGKDKIIKE